MKFQDYLAKTIEIADEEKSVLDELSSRDELNKIEFRAAKSSLQTLIENANSMIHDYMKFDKAVLIEIVKAKRYMDIYHFLLEVPEYNDIIKKRIETFSI